MHTYPLNHRFMLPALLLATALLLPSHSPQAADDVAPGYELLDGVLLRGVRNGFVDYDSIRLDPAFADFVEQVGAASEEMLREPNDRLAFYINAYNALAIQGILDGRSPRSAWGRLLFFRLAGYTVHGTKMNLSELEKERLIPIGDPRIHFAIVCASISCPRLSDRAYEPETMDDDLNTAARRFINDQSRNRFDLARKTAYLSRIFAWYQPDFEAAAGSVQTYLSGFVDNPEVAAALEKGEFHLEFDDYDWNLNGSFTKPGRRPAD